MQFSKHIVFTLFIDIASNKLEINVTLILLCEKLKLSMSTDANKKKAEFYYSSISYLKSFITTKNVEKVA